MDYSPENYFKTWGHYPFFDDPDPEGFNKRVKIIEKHGYNKGMEIIKEQDGK